MSLRAVMFCLGFSALCAEAQSLSIRGAPASLRLMGRTDAVNVERLDVNGSPVTTGTLQVTFTAPPGAQVAIAPEPNANWTSRVTVAIPPGSSVSAPVYLRSGVQGLQSWTASGQGFTITMASIFVRHDALTCDVETGKTLVTDVPPGCFNTRITPYPQSTIAPSASAAHRGNFGLRLVDGEAGTGAAADTAAFDDGAPLFGDFHARTWLRVVSANGLGVPIFAQVTNGTGLSPSLLDVKMRPDLNLTIAGFEIDGGYSEVVADAGLRIGVWHLMELSVTGVGSADGGRLLWLDGERVAYQRGVDFSGTRLPVARFAVGEPYVDGREWLGTVDFDDIRTAGAPLATGFSLYLPVDGGFVGECLSLEVQLRAGFGGGLAATRELLQVTLDAGAKATLFEDPSCARPITGVPMQTDTASAILWVRATQPAPSVLATHPDFLPGASTLDVTAPPTLMLAPSLMVVAPGALVNFSLTGGTGRERSFRFVTNTSGAVIDSNGRYQAGAMSGDDVVRARDSAGLTAQGTVQVVALDAGMTGDAGMAVDAGTPGTPDAGTPELDGGVKPLPRRSLGVGCGCQGGGSSLLFLLLLVWRRRHHRPKLLSTRAMASSP